MIGAIRELCKRIDPNRSSLWPTVRKEVIARDRFCKACGKKHNLQVHHIVPFRVLPGRELDKTNLITLCGRCHLMIGHLDYWRAYNLSVVEDANRVLMRIMRRTI